MERKNIGTLTGNDALPCVSARRITLPFPFTVIFTTRRVTLCMIVERSRRGSIILFQPTLYISLFPPIIYNISRAPSFFREPCGFFEPDCQPRSPNLGSNEDPSRKRPAFSPSFPLRVHAHNYFFFFFPFFLRTWPSRRKEARDGELSLLGRLEDPFRGGGRMTRESLLLVSSRHSKREPRISRACDETQERHSREPLESGDLSSKRTLALLTRLSRKKEKRATFVRCDELIFFFLFSSSRRTRPSFLYTRSFDAYVVDFSSFSRRTERGGGPMHETAWTSLFFTEQPIVTFKKRNCVIVVSRL